MPNDNKIAIITIESIVPSDYGVKLNAQDKKVYNVSKTKKDGTPSVAWQQLTDMGLKGTDPISGTAGSTVEIWYRESPNSHGGTSRYISSFKETNGVPTETPRQGANIASQGESKETFWDKKAFKQCLWGEYLRLGRPLTQQDRDQVWAEFNNIEQDADERYSKPKGWAELGQKLKAQNPTPDVSNTQQAGMAKLTNEEPPISADVQELADQMEVNGDDLPF